MHIPSGLMDISINCIRAFNDNEILIATDGAGVYKMNTDTYESDTVYRCRLQSVQLNERKYYQ